MTDLARRLVLDSILELVFLIKHTKYVLNDAIKYNTIKRSSSTHILKAAFNGIYTSKDRNLFFFYFENE